MLYDAVTLYAWALAMVMKEGGDARDGRAIANKLFGHRYMSIQGFEVKIDSHGNPEGNYSLLAYAPMDRYNISLHERRGINYTVDQVANFWFDPDGELPRLSLRPGAGIPWVGGAPCLAEPLCGYRGERCASPESVVTELVAGLLGGVILVILVALIAVYRNWRYEQEIAGLLWRIDASAIQCSDAGPQRGEYRADAGPCDRTSYISTESHNSYAQVYTYVGRFKGQLVALKTFAISSCKVTRRDKLEMKLIRDLRHTNVNSFIGACLEASVLTLVTAYCVKGSLQDLLENDNIRLDDMFTASLVKDFIQGMLYIHSSELEFHGNLKSSNCVVTSRWTLQVADQGLLDIRRNTLRKEGRHAYYRNMLWTAPEILQSEGKVKGSQAGDVYAFAIVMHEIFARQGPFGNTEMDPQDIVDRVASDKTPFRPDTSCLQCAAYVNDVITSCWAQEPHLRPDFHVVWAQLKPMRAGMKRNIMDHMLSLMETYQTHLEDLVDDRTQQLQGEKRKTETLLYRMLPRPVADQLRRGSTVVPEAFDCVTIYFSDICGFTSLSAESTPMQVVDMLNDLYTCFDSILQNFDVYKVETIGDAYMVVSGLPLRNGASHAAQIASMSLALLTAIKGFTVRHRQDVRLKLRIGIHSGPVVAGVVGQTMPRYTLFGDTVNTASRMESNGEALKIHCSAECKTILDKVGGFHLKERGYIAMKGKGKQLTYWLLGEEKRVALPEVRTSLSLDSSSHVQTKRNSKHRLSLYSRSFRLRPASHQPPMTPPRHPRHRHSATSTLPTLTFTPEGQQTLTTSADHFSMATITARKSSISNSSASDRDPSTRVLPPSNISNPGGDGGNRVFPNIMALEPITSEHSLSEDEQRELRGVGRGSGTGHVTDIASDHLRGHLNDHVTDHVTEASTLLHGSHDGDCQL